jgi:hypothetical protein
MVTILHPELELKDVEGMGYNDRNKTPTKDEKKEWLYNIVKAAIFGGKADMYSSEFQVFLDTGKMPTGFRYISGKRRESEHRETAPIIALWLRISMKVGSLTSYFLVFGNFSHQIVNM